MHSHVHNLRKAIGLEDAPVLTMDQLLACHCRTCNNLESTDTGVKMVKGFRKQASENERAFPYFRDVCPKYNECPLQDLEVMVFDEVGVYDVHLLARVLATVVRCAPRLRRIIFSGDIMQLPPIGVGHVARDLSYGVGMVIMEHGHRYDKLALVDLARTILRHEQVTAASVDNESTFYIECTASWKASYEAQSQDSAIHIVKKLYSAGGEEVQYHKSMVVAHKNEIARLAARVIDTWYLLDRERRLKGEEAHRSLKYTFDTFGGGGVPSGRFYPGQKIMMVGTSMPRMGITNRDRLCVIDIVEGQFIHRSAEDDLAGVYQDMFSAVCQMIEAETGHAGDPKPLQDLARRFKEDPQMAEVIRTRCHVGLKASLERQARTQQLMAQQLKQSAARWLHRQRDEVYALRHCSVGMAPGMISLGYSKYHRHPQAVDRRERCNDVLFSPYGERKETRSVTEPFQYQKKAYAEKEVANTLAFLMQSPLVEAILVHYGIDIEEERAVEFWKRSKAYRFVVGPILEMLHLAMADLTDRGEFMPAYGQHVPDKFTPCFEAMRAAASDYYSCNKISIKVLADDYLNFKVTRILKDSGAPVDDGEGERVKFIRCRVMGANDEEDIAGESAERVVFIPIVSHVMNTIRSASAITFFGAQSNSAKTVIVVMPYGGFEEEIYMAVTRAEQRCILVTNDFAMRKTKGRRFAARISYLGAKIRMQCHLPRVVSQPISEETNAMLTRLECQHVENTAVTKREGESRSERNLRVKSFLKRHALTMPRDQVLPDKNFGLRQMKWIEKMQSNLPYMLYAPDEHWPVNEFVKREEFDISEWSTTTEGDDAYALQGDRCLSESESESEEESDEDEDVEMSE